MAAAGPNFSDLAPRIISALVLIAVAGVGLWLGGLVLAILLAVLGAAMLWEYFRLIIRLSAPRASFYTVASAILLCTSLVLEHVYLPEPVAGGGAPIWPATAALVLLALTIAAVVAAVRASLLEVLFGAMIPLATFLFFFLHQSVPLAMWLVVATVIAVDVAGYFFGKLIGGPKFWPSLSPNKTWAGTTAGWISAALIALAVGLWKEPAQIWIGVVFLVLVAFAAQMADIAESALKRRAGVKDSSNLLPGHGGVLDRFDGMMGAFTVAGLAFMLIGFAMVPG